MQTNQLPSNYRTLLIAIILLLLCLLARAQAPKQFSFQGVARDAAGKVIGNANIAIRLTIHLGAADGPSSFTEEHNVQTGAGGIFNVSVGSAGGNLALVDWKANSYFLQVEMDQEGGSNYSDIGTTQLLSVPYALHAEEAARLKNDDPIVLKGTFGSGNILSGVGSGSRLIWYPRKSAFRVGHTIGGWEDGSIGDYSIAMGHGSNASGKYSTALGKSSAADGKDAIALGSGANASNEFSTALGYGATASAQGSISLGFSDATNDFAVAIGYETLASGGHSVSIGAASKSTGFHSVAMGGGSLASGSYSVAIGESSRAKALRSTTLGAYNWIGDNPNPDVAAATDRIFQIGNGTGENTRSNAMTIMRNGNIGLGNNTVDPQFPLDVAGRLRIRHNGSTAGIYLDASQSAAEGFVGMKTDKEIGLYINAAWRFWVNDQGNGYLNGNLIQTSDRRLKTNIQPFKNSLAKVNNLQGYHYNWEDKAKDQTLQTGLIAQEVEAIFPELVSTNKDGFKSVNYIGLVPHLIESVKELKSKTDEIAVLRKELEGMREMGKRLELLEASINKGAGVSEVKTAAK
ncbi:tail fiber domain-containing protein [Dyadobacter psychrophilus]|uniref:Head domain of trimeric autotransporter adhesin n=1 Tax=Dyadobacter psychrophilus TaxID=651661 RepID=A0A1T5DTN4_9BACT|nr:tail fiber domain-containing protein [Dyadobacter psychrophilus]SKB75192.1 Head domain of trimeric autotransporter adhesin [Dyadobacter psychrophilus]